MSHRVLSASFALLAIVSPPGYAAAAGDPAACAVLLAKKVSDPERAGDVLNAAETLWPERPAEAAEILSRAHELAKASKKPESLDLVARLYTKFGQKAKAMELATQLLGDGSTQWAKGYWSLPLLAELGEIHLALELLKTREPEAAGVSVAHQYLKAGQKDRALDLLAQAVEEVKRRAPGDHWQAGPCEAAADGYAAAGEFDRAVAVAERIPETLDELAYQGEERHSPVRYKVAALVKIALWCIEAGQGKRAREVLARARAIAQNIRHRYLKSEMLREVAVAYTGAEPDARVYWRTGSANRVPLDPARAIETARAIGHPLVKARALYDVAGQLLKAGNREMFLAAQSEAVQTAFAIEDESDDASIGELDFACDDKCTVLFTLAAAFVQAGEKQRAADVLTRMAAAARGERFPTERAVTMVRLAERLAELGETKLALDLTAEAGELAKHKDVRSFHHHEASVLAAAGRAYLAQGEKDKGWEFLRRAIQAAKGPEGDDAGYVMSGTAARLGKAGRFDEAFQLAMAIEQPVTRAVAFREFGHLCVQAGRYEQALEAAREVREPATRLALLAAIGKRYPGNGAEVSARARALLDELAR